MNRPIAAEGMRSVGALLAELRSARSKMGVNNPNRALIEQCTIALTETSVRLHEAQKRQLKTLSEIQHLRRDLGEFVTLLTADEPSTSNPALAAQAAGIAATVSAWDEALATLETLHRQEGGTDGS